MKKSLSALFVILSILSNPAYCIPISADLNISTPATLTDQATLTPDFSFDTENFIIDNLILSLTFSGNILDPLDNFSISYQNNQLTSSQQINLSFLPVNNLSFDVSDLLISPSITSNILIFTNGDGVNISSISLTGNATSVPEPTILVLLVTGLFAAFGATKRRKQ